jgi:AbrB family looped-hinge helix DNA binding protein
MTLVRIKQNFQITLPADVRKHLNIAQGDYLEASIRDNEIILTPKALIDRETEVIERESREVAAVKA